MKYPWKSLVNGQVKNLTDEDAVKFLVEWGETPEMAERIIFRERIVYWSPPYDTGPVGVELALARDPRQLADIEIE